MIALTNNKIVRINDVDVLDQPLHISRFQFSKPSLAFKMGELASKTVNFFKKTETKTTALISYWTVETVLFTLIIISLTNPYAVIAAAFLYLYGTYVLFSAVNALTR